MARRRINHEDEIVAIVSGFRIEGVVDKYEILTEGWIMIDHWAVREADISAWRKR